MRLPISAIAVVATLLPALARDNGQWTDKPPEIRAWFRSVMQPGFENMPDVGHSCCGEADAFDVEMAGGDVYGIIRVRILDGKGVLPDGTIVDVPRDKLQAKYGNPLDKFILFVGAGMNIYCLVPKGGV
jgi:hypothetical protein